MGSVVRKVTNTLGLTADGEAGQAQVQQANALQERAVRELEKLGIPSLEAQKIVLEEPELVLSTLQDRLGPSAFDDIEIDPRLQESELDALSALQQAGQEGFTAEDKARQEALRSQIAGDEQARQASILQQMAQRGALDSGAQLAAQLGSSQAATQRASEQAVQMAGQQAAARRNALAQAANLAGQMGQRQFGQQAQQARARDTIQRFNAGVSARDTAARQQQAERKAQLSNQQQMYNKGLIQQQFQNQLAKATGVTGALGNQAQQAMQAGAMAAHADQQAAAGTRGILTGGIKAATTGGMFADGGIAGLNPLDNIMGDLDALGLPNPQAPALQTDVPLQAGLTLNDIKQPVVEEAKKEEPKEKNKTLEALEAFGSGFKEGSALLPAMKMVNINPNNIGAMIRASQQMSAADGGVKLGELPSEDRIGLGNKLGGEDITEEQLKKEALMKAIAQQQMIQKRAEQEKILERRIASEQEPVKPQLSPEKAELIELINKFNNREFADGGMNYESGGMGAIIDSGLDSFSGDDLPDRINDGEMVLNLDQQDRIEDLLKELAERRRADNMVDNGEAQVNDIQQETLMDIARGNAEPEDLAMDSDIVENSIDDLLALLQDYNAFQDGGIQSLSPINAEKKMIEDYKNNQILDRLMTAEQPLDLDNITESLATLGQPKPNMTPMQQEPVDYSQMMSVGEPDLGEKIEGKIDSKQVKQANKEVASANASKDSDLEDAKKKDALFGFLDDMNNALAHYDAANPNAMLKPIQSEGRRGDFEAKLKEARKIAADKDFKERQLKVTQAAKAEDRAFKEKQFEAQQSDKEKELDLKKDELQLKKDKLAKPSKDERKEIKEAKKNIQKIEEKREKIERAKKLIRNARGFGDTGPLDQYLPTKQRQEIEMVLNELALEKMGEMFEGMSKAIDSDAERAFFQASQPSIGNFAETNLKALDRALERLDKNENIIREELGRDPVKKEKKTSVFETKDAPSSKEIRRRTKDGRIAIFDENKKFLRYEE